MKRINLSKSRYCSAVQCEKILWLNQNKPELSPVEDKTIFEKGRQVGELAKGLFGDYEDVTTDADFSTRLNETERLLQSKSNIITEASLSFNGNFCSVDILKNDSDGVEIYEVKSSTKLKDNYLDDVSYQYSALKGFGFNVM